MAQILIKDLLIIGLVVVISLNSSITINQQETMKATIDIRTTMQLEAIEAILLLKANNLVQMISRSSVAKVF